LKEDAWHFTLEEEKKKLTVSFDVLIVLYKMVYFLCWLLWKQKTIMFFSLIDYKKRLVEKKKTLFLCKKTLEIKGKTLLDYLKKIKTMEGQGYPGIMFVYYYFIMFL
jgi:hypothetical protein